MKWAFHLNQGTKMSDQDEKDKKDLEKEAQDHDSEEQQKSPDWEKRYLLVMPNSKEAISLDTLEPPPEARKILAQKAANTKLSRSHRKSLFWFSMFFCFIFLLLLIAEIVLLFLWLLFEPQASLGVLGIVTVSTAFIGWILLWTCVRASTKY
ncbi:MAG: hypothetical protein LUC43_04360 [Burkholderiales bacterium]|nr:hypothetical protein [Burkholderiales bacterium]